MENMELQAKISVDTSELDSAIKKAKRLGGMLRSVEKRINDIAKKQKEQGEVFFDEFAPISDNAWSDIFPKFQSIATCKLCNCKPLLLHEKRHKRLAFTFSCECGTELTHSDYEILVKLWNNINK